MRSASLLFLLPALAWPATYFEPNRGQAGDQAAFVARSGNRVATIAPGAVNMPGGELEFAGSTASAQIEGIDRQHGVSHYALHRDPSRWIYDVPHYGAAVTRGVYQGIDVRYHDSPEHDRIEFDFEIAAHADPSVILLRFGSDVQVLPDGGLRAGAIALHRPGAWQVRAGKRREVPVRFDKRGDRLARFEVGAFDPSLPLIIDPVIDFATYLGGSNIEADTHVITDSAGYIYMAGSTYSPDFPANPSRASSLNIPVVLLQPDLYVARLEPNASAIDWSFFIGGLGSDQCGGLAQDSLGNIYVLGASSSPDFPVTPGAYHAQIDAGSFDGGFSDEVLVKLDGLTGHIKASTFLGLRSSSQGGTFGALAVDAAGGAYIGGLAGAAFQPTAGAYLTKPPASDGVNVLLRLNSSLTAAAYATYLTGSVRKIQVDATGSAIFAGGSTSSPFPAVNPIPGINQTIVGLGNFTAMYVAKMNPTGSALTFASLLDGNLTRDSSVMDLILDPAGNIRILGLSSDPQFPVVNPIQFDHGSSSKPTENLYPSTFLAVLPPGGGQYIQSTLLYGPTYTVQGGVPDPVYYQMALAGGRLCIAGFGQGPLSFQTAGGLIPFPVGAQLASGGGTWLQCLDTADTRIEIKTALPYTGGSYTSLAPTPDGALLLAGTALGSLTTTAGVVQPHYAGGANPTFGSAFADAFLFRVSLPNPAPTVSAAFPDFFTLTPGTLSFSLTGSGFAYGEQATINGQAGTASFISPTVLSLSSVSSSVLNAGPNVLSVSMPGPGGGTTAVQITGVNPAPGALSITPAQVNAGAAETKVVISGSSLLPSSVITWNGTTRSGNYVAALNSTPRFEFLLEPSDLAQPSNSTITVMNPPPGGGMSAPLHFIVQGTTNAVPVVTGPTVIGVSASPPASVNVTGTGFTSSTQVFWDGASIPTTFNSATSLTVNPPLKDRSTVSAHDVYATSGNLASSPVRVYVTGSTPFFLSPPIYAPGGNRLFVFAAQSSPSGTVQAITVYDTVSGAKLLSTTTAFQISSVAASDDGQYLYLAGGQSQNEIMRLNVASQSFDLDWQVAAPRLTTTASVSAIFAVPGSAQSLIAVVSYQSEVPYVPGSIVTTGTDVVIFDRDQPRFLRATDVGLNFLRIDSNVTYAATPVFASANRLIFQASNGGSGVPPCFLWADFDGAGVEGGDTTCLAFPRELVFAHTLAYLTDGVHAVVPNGFVLNSAMLPLVDPVARKVYTYVSGLPASLLTVLDLDTRVSTAVSAGPAGSSATFYTAPDGILVATPNIFYVIPIPGTATASKQAHRSGGPPIRSGTRE